MLVYGLFAIILLALLPNIIQFFYNITIYAAVNGDIISYISLFVIYLFLYYGFKLIGNKFELISGKLNQIIIYVGVLHIYGCLIATSLLKYYYLIAFVIAAPIIFWKRHLIYNYLVYLRYTLKFTNPFIRTFYDYRGECLVIPFNNKYIFIKMVEIEPFKEILPLLISISRFSGPCWFTFEVLKFNQEYSIYLSFLVESKNYFTGLSNLIDYFTKIIHILERLGYYYIIIDDEISLEKKFFTMIYSEPFIYNENGLIKNFPLIKLNKEDIEIKNKYCTNNIKLFKINNDFSFRLNEILCSNNSHFYWICQLKPFSSEEYKIKQKTIKNSLKSIYDQMQDKLIEKEKKLQFLIMMGNINKNKELGSDSLSYYAFGEKLLKKKNEHEKLLLKYQTGEIIGLYNVSCYLFIDSNSSKIIDDLIGVNLEPMNSINIFNILTRKVKPHYEMTSKEILNFLPFPTDTDDLPQ